MNRWTFLALIPLVGCSSSERPAPGRPAPVEAFASSDNEATQAAGAPVTSAKPDGPHISRSTGEEGGLVVFWPRVIPKTDDAEIRSLAKTLQQRLVAVASKRFDKIDMRPEPERVCPQSGCDGATLGVLLAHGGGGCTAVALVAEAGQSPSKLVPWAGLVRLKREEVGFRDYPESALTIKDAVPCDDLAKALAAKEADILAALPTP